MYVQRRPDFHHQGRIRNGGAMALGNIAQLVALIITLLGPGTAGFFYLEKSISDVQQLLISEQLANTKNCDEMEKQISDLKILQAEESMARKLGDEGKKK